MSEKLVINETQDDSPISSPNTYNIPFVFIIYLIESLFYGFIFFTIIKENTFINYDMKNLLIIFVILGTVLFIGMKSYERSCDNCLCTFILFILITSFKIFFIYTIYRGNKYVIKIKINDYCFLFWSAGISLFYIILIIISLIKKKISLGLYFLVGCLTSVISAVVEYIRSKEIENSLACGSLGLIEVIFLCISINIAISRNRLSNKKTLGNLIYIDYYKYFIILFAFFLVVSLILCIIAAFCKSASEVSGSSSSSQQKRDPPRPVYEDPVTHALGDQYGHPYWPGQN